MVDGPLGMTSLDLTILGMQGDVVDGWMDLNTTEVNKGQVRLVNCYVEILQLVVT